MQYYVKIFNKETGELVGYYKETGISCISKMMKGMKYFNDIESAFAVAQELDEGFIRDKDGHYYTSHVVVYGDSTREVPKNVYKNNIEKEEEVQDALKTFIRKNSNKNR